ncbi:MAG TPA: MoxR family ATPase, partial [Smithellaceae bacterium]|nr:MoxR family ATPase [Smithellaceae bacterium]
RTAVRIPFVLLTSNNYRDMSDALKRRCVHLYIDYPARDTEISIVRLKIPDIEERLCAVLVDSIRKIRTLDLKKSPSISETLDWAQSLLALQITELTPEVISETLNVICKYQADLEKVRKNIDRVVAGAG